MKLKNKILISIGLVWVLFFAASYAGAHFFLTNGFLKLEEEKSQRDLSRVDEALDQVSYSLLTFTSDWSNWNDLYSYMQGKNPSFVRNNINLPAFMTSSINFLGYWDLQGKRRVFASADTDKGQFSKTPEGLANYLTANSPLLNQTGEEKEMRGYILLPEGIMMIATSAITDSNKEKPPLGLMITGRLVSPKIIQKIQERTRLAIQLILPKQIERDARLSELYKNMVENHKNHFAKSLNDETLMGYTIIRDINNQPIGLFQISTRRSIYLNGLETVRFYLTGFILLGIVISILMWWLLRKLVIQRLERLDHQVGMIGSGNLVNQRVTVDGNDELTTVSNQINSMLNTIQASHEQLEDRVKERTKELQQTNQQLEQEITERKTVEKELVLHKEHLVKLAHYDSLTSLPNRVYFNEKLNKCISQAAHNHKIFAILFIDLDRFKTINDALGHNIGDLVLKEMAVRFSNSLREGDLIARLGGDEFIILLKDIFHPEAATTVAEKLIEASKLPIKIHQYEFHLSASIGICLYPYDGHSLEDLQKNADMAMYKAKRAGGGIYEYYVADMHQEATQYVQLEAALRKALTNNEFVLHYQPKLNLMDGTTDSVEALIRWENPELGIVSPAKFIPLAEETGLILQIGEWALREACRANKKWQEQGYHPIRVSVNISPKQFSHQDTLELIKSILNETKLAPTYLELEVTESTMMDSLESTATKLTQINKLGISIAIDDFGTGYTSINYFKQFPVNVIKIDQSFVKGMTTHENDFSIVQGIIALAHSLSIKVVAEGVETAEQLQSLADLKCDLVQGYYLSKPLPEDKLLDFLTKKYPVESPVFFKQ